MNKRVVSVELPPDLFLAVHDLATEQEGTIGAVVEDLLVAHLETHKSAKPKERVADERLVFALQKLLFRDLADACDWAALDKRLRQHGYFMKIAWGGLLRDDDLEDTARASSLGTWMVFDRLDRPEGDLAAQRPRHGQRLRSAVSGSLVDR